MRIFDRGLGVLLGLGLAGCSAPAPRLLHFAPSRPSAESPAGPPRPTTLVLTFDDGPSNQRFEVLGTDEQGRPRTPTEAVLDVLREEGIAAAFFVLTGPDVGFAGRRLAKGETALGLLTLRRTLREGHLLGCHWGGHYGSQLRGHPASLAQPAYDADDDGQLDRVSPEGNALESELLACMHRISRAYTEEGRSPERVGFVRPPAWRFEDGARDARPTYAALGLEMVLADVRVLDGVLTHGLSWFSGSLVDDVVRRVRAGDPDVVIALHDVNRRTAAGLPDVLHRLRTRLAAEALVEGVAWRFARDAQEVRDALHERHWGE